MFALRQISRVRAKRTGGRKDENRETVWKQHVAQSFPKPTYYVASALILCLLKRLRGELPHVHGENAFGRVDRVPDGWLFEYDCTLGLAF